MRETDGELVYRIFREEIDYYRSLFEEVESDWNTHVQRCAYFDADFRFVSRLSKPYRTIYWQDKIRWFEMNLFTATQCIPFSRYESMYWHDHPILYEQMEAELLAALNRYVLKEGTSEASKMFVLRQLNPLSTSVTTITI